MNAINRRKFIEQSLSRSVQLAAIAGVLGRIPATHAAEPASNGPPIRLNIRRRIDDPAAGGRFNVVEKEEQWKPRETALIICDMWDQHWCQGASRRVVELSPRMNQFISAARQRGVLIIHAPSSCMDPYKDHPARKRAQSAPKAANLPSDIASWCKQIPAEEKGKYPIDQSDGGCDCEPKCPSGSPWRRQVDLLEIRDEDAISDSGVEIWNLLEHRGVRNVMIMGVHTNMCVLGRPFGLRQMSKNGKNTVLIRDMTDTMYNSKAWPHVNHFEGTDLIVEHIEKYVAGTITSVSLLGGERFRFKADTRPRNGRS